MANNDKVRERARRRADPAEAKGVFERLAPDTSDRSQLLARFASAIELAHGLAPSCWELTLHVGYQSVSLSVGSIYVIKVDHEGLRVALDEEGLNPADREEVLRQVQDLGAFKAVRGRLIGSSLEAGLRLWPRLEAGHRQIVRAAAQAMKKSPFYYAHSPGVVDYIAKQLGRSIPQPAYATGEGAEGVVLSEEKRAEMTRLFAECAAQYLPSPDGVKHRAAYTAAREEARQSFGELTEAAAHGKDVTDRVLLRLLPHADTVGNRERGAWIHIAPAITKDVRTFFEGAGWAKAEDWPIVARAVLRFVQRAESDPDALSEAIAEFEEACPARGFQAGMLSPILNALRPEAFPILNSKSRRLVNYLSGQHFGQSLQEYPEVRTVILALVEELADVLSGPAVQGLLPSDAFDAFGHWLWAIKEHDDGLRRFWKVAPGENASSWTQWREGGFVAIGWGDLGDLAGIARPEFVRRRNELTARHKGEPGWTKVGLNQVWKFSRIEVGDRVVANRGTTEVLGVGTVVEPYSYLPGQQHPHRLGVRWDDLAHRSVNQPGWRKSLIELDKDEFETIVAITPRPAEAGDERAGQEVFPRMAFKWLAKLAAEPTREFYLAHKDDLVAAVEDPFQEFFHRVVALLPPAVAERMETEKNVYGRFLKNDWGRGGAWDYYWGALYPKGGRRVEDAQLFILINQNHLKYGFSVGQYGGAQSSRLLENLRRQERLVEHLLSGSGLRGVTYGRVGVQAGAPTSRGLADWREWLADPGKHGLDVQVVLSPSDLKGRELDGLARDIAAAFEALFPLVLLATSDDPVPEIRIYLGEDGGSGDVVQPEYGLESLSTDSGLPREILARWVAAIERKGQAIVFGPPGTGKTYIARHLARHLVGGGTGFVEFLQFHPAYSYEDFIQGIRPIATSGSQLSYELVKGRFLEVCDKAEACPSHPCVLILDEINRANLARVFGELMYLLEYRTESIPLAGSRTLRVPANLHIIGTMNTADRSIALVDHALRRRFAFLRLEPQYEALARYHAERETGVSGEKLAQVLRKVNQAIDDPHYEVGTSFFLSEELAEHFADVWRMEIEPYLEEYFFDKPERVDEYRWEKVRSQLGLDE